MNHMKPNIIAERSEGFLQPSAIRSKDLLRVKGEPCARSEGAQPSESRCGRPAGQLNRVVDYIETHLAEKMMVTELADLANVSVRQLVRAFKISLGVRPSHYIAGRRVELACVMMTTTREPLSQIAIACGLCDQAHLCKVFRRMIGMSPSAWRREQGASGVDAITVRRPSIGDRRSDICDRHQSAAHPDLGSAEELTGLSADQRDDSFSNPALAAVSVTVLVPHH